MSSNKIKEELLETAGERQKVATAETAEATTTTQRETPDQQQTTEKKVNNFNGNLLYEGNLGCIPGTIRGK